LKAFKPLADIRIFMMVRNLTVDMLLITSVHHGYENAGIESSPASFAITPTALRQEIPIGSYKLIYAYNPLDFRRKTGTTQPVIHQERMRFREDIISVDTPRLIARHERWHYLCDNLVVVLYDDQII
jgi:hypothetical protein